MATEIENKIPSLVEGFDEQFHLVDASGNFLVNQPYKIIGSNGQSWRGVTDRNGLTKRVVTKEPISLSIEILSNGNGTKKIIE